MILLPLNALESVALGGLRRSDTALGYDVA